MRTSPTVDQTRAARRSLGLILLVEADPGARLESCLRELGYVVIGPFDAAESVERVLRSLIPDGAVLDTNAGRETFTFTAYRLKELGVPFLVIAGGGLFDLTDPVLATIPVLSNTLANQHLGEFMRNLLRTHHAAHMDGEA